MTAAKKVSVKTAEPKKLYVVSPKKFDDFDLLELKAFGSSLKRYAITEYPYTEGSLVMSLNGQFGCGKTCFLEMFANQLRDDGYEAVYINAWKNDFFDEPIITLVSELLDYSESKQTGLGKVSKQLKESLLSVVGNTAAIANQVISHTTGVDIKEVGELSEKEMERRDVRLGNAVFKEYLERKGLFEKMNQTLDQCITVIEKKPLFILVDELDRTRPDYAVKFIETLKHFFWTNGIVFILAVDREHLAASVKSLYGNEIKFAEYYRKFIHRNIMFPKATETATNKYIRKRIEEHFDPQSRSRHYVYKLDQYRQENLLALCIAFDFVPRQIDELFRLLSHFLSTQKENTQGIFGWVLASFVYAAIKIHDESIAAKIRLGNYTYSDYLDLFSQQQIAHSERRFDSDWWAQMLLFIASNAERYSQNIEIFMSKFKPLLDKGSDDYKSTVAEIGNCSHQIVDMRGLPRTNSIMEMLAAKVEKCLTFLED